MMMCFSALMIDVFMQFTVTSSVYVYPLLANAVD